MRRAASGEAAPGETTDTTTEEEEAVTNRPQPFGLARLAGVLFVGSTALTAVMLTNGQLDVVLALLALCLTAILVLALTVAIVILTRR